MRTSNSSRSGGDGVAARDEMSESTEKQELKEGDRLARNLHYRQVAVRRRWSLADDGRRRVTTDPVGSSRYTMNIKSPKATFWRVLVTVNLMSLVLPIGFLLQADSDPLRLIAVVAIYGTAFLLMIADTVSICCSYFMDS